MKYELESELDHRESCYKAAWLVVGTQLQAAKYSTMVWSMAAKAREAYEKEEGTEHFICFSLQLDSIKCFIYRIHIILHFNSHHRTSTPKRCYPILPQKH